MKVKHVALTFDKSLSCLLSVLSDCLMYGELVLLDIEKQIQQLQAQRSNLPKVDIGEKVGTSSRNLYNLHKIFALFNYVLCFLTKQENPVVEPSFYNVVFTYLLT